MKDKNTDQRQNSKQIKAFLSQTLKMLSSALLCQRQQVNTALHTDTGIDLSELNVCFMFAFSAGFR